MKLCAMKNYAQNELLMKQEFKRANERSCGSLVLNGDSGEKIYSWRDPLTVSFMQQILLSSYQEPCTAGDRVEDKKDRTLCLPGFDILVGRGSKLYHMLEGISFMVKH